ncbi:DUF1266 domain-containing protein [Streptomyces sp. NPDC086023]|uniref:DUF1266 domain-containing protein n=1 Tax=Streptomyces sp. NPDC086023 TaxID=3365746 RepID=UPI0037D6D4F1
MAETAWQAPSLTERRLYEAKTRNDWAAYLAVLAESHLFMAQSRAAVDARPDETFFHPYTDPRSGARCIAVRTVGLLPAPAPDPVFERVSLYGLANTWRADDPPYLAVNPGTPCEAYLPTTPEDRAGWLRHSAATEVYGLPDGAVHALHLGGPLHGPVARGLAVGAHLAVHNRQFWNAMAFHGEGYRKEREKLEEWWGITTPAEWAETQADLLATEFGAGGTWESVLGIRHALSRTYGGLVGTDHWRQAAEQVLRRNAEERARPRLTPDGVTAPTPGRLDSLEAEVAGVRRLIGRIARYEARFRADGLLGEGRYVRSVEAWDLGRASQMARWGLASRFCTLEEAEQAVVRAGKAARLTYRSWEDFSAGYVLGRCLHFDEEEFGRWYEDMLDVHRLLTTDPGSPWRNIPW